MSYLQPDHFENEKKNMSDFLSQNPLVMLARTCQNIGLEHHKSSERSKLSSPSSAASGPYKSYPNSLGESSLFSMSQSTSPTVSGVSKTRVSLSATHRFSPPVGFSSPSSTGTTTTTATFLPPSPSAVANNKEQGLKSLSGDEADLQTHPSSDSLIQLARLSSSLKLPGDRQKRNKPLESRLQTNYCRQQKRVRRQSFSRPSSGTAATSKPIDFTLHPTAIASQRRSNTSTPSTPSSVSPSSLRSSPPAHSTSPFSIRNGTMLDLTSTAGTAVPAPPSSSASATSCLEMFYTVGNALGAPPERLRELLVTVAQALMDRSQSTETHRPPATSSASPGLLFEGNEGTHQAAVAPTPELLVPTPSVTATQPDPNALFLAWLNIFRPSCASEALTAATAHRFG
ncbi:hypothetical protein AAHC03_017109 [Spirometra sp. Aus1]